MKEIIRQLQGILPAENFLLQPSSAEEHLMKMEKEYGISTADFIRKKVDISHIPSTIQEEWINVLEIYILFTKTSEEEFEGNLLEAGYGEIKHSSESGWKMEE